jgi:hypothetical protein
VNDKVDDPSQTHSQKTEQNIDKKQLNEIKDIFNHFEKTFSQMKIFSSEHENVESFIDLLHDRLSKYLKKYWKLEIGIEEFSFTHQGFPFYKEEQLSKSLPFLFYKDGIKMLFFYQGLTKEELKDFLEIMRMDASLPPEESDIVISLWEKDFANIRYFAPDDYLETKIGIGIKIPEYKIDKDKLFSGKITLRPEDKSALEKKDKTIQNNSQKIFKEKTGTEKALLSKSEEELLKNMLQDHRRESQAKQYKTLLLDILYLEKRPEKMNLLINQLIQYVNQQISIGNFKIALSVYEEVSELRDYLSETDSPRKKIIQEFFDSPKIEVTLSQIEEILHKEPIYEFDAFLKYLSFMGPKSIPILSYLYDHVEKPEQKDKIITTLKLAGKENFSELIKIARDERPDLTLKIISILRDSKEERAINHLASFLSFGNKKVLYAAIKAIGNFKNPNANKILFSLFSHEDPEIRILAAENIYMTDKEPVFEKILQEVKEKKFKKKSKKQKEALLLALARSQSKKAFEVLENIIKKVGFFSGSKKVESALSALKALEKGGGLTGYGIIKNLIHTRNRKIRKKCQELEKKLSQNIKKESSYDKF